MNINITWPTKHQVAVFGSHTVVGAGAVIGTLAFTGLLSPADVQTATHDVSRIAADVTDLVGALASLGAIGMALFSTVRSGPIGSFFRAAMAINSDARLIDKVKGASLDQKAPLVAITDQIPEVGSVATINTRAGAALATAVASPTVQVRSTT